MKTFENGALSESDGPPLDHDEWVAEFQKNQAADLKRKEEERDRLAKRGQERRAASRAGGRDEGGEGGDEEPTFRGRPLSDFDNVPDDQLTNEEGVGEATAKEIVKARHKRDRDRGR